MMMLYQPLAEKIILGTSVSKLIFIGMYKEDWIMSQEIKDRLRKTLLEEVNGITRLECFDFDGTLIATPLSDVGIPIWEKVYKKKFPYNGWWGQVESLDTDIFEMNVIPQVGTAYQKAKARPDTMVVMATGRQNVPELTSAVKGILDSKGMTFDEYRFNTGGDTGDIKRYQLNVILGANLNITEVILYDDREVHFEMFEAWGAELLEGGIVTSFNLVRIPSTRH